MTDWQVAETVLRISNGELFIVTAWLSVFLAYHLVKVGAQRRVWRGMSWRKLPMSMQLAVALLTVSIAVTVMSSELVAPAGHVLGVIGFLCALRVVTKPMLGSWPWFGAVGCGILYAIVSVILLF